MSASDPTPIVGLFVTPDGATYPNQPLVWRKAGGAVTAYPGKTSVPEPVVVHTGPTGQISCAFLSGVYRITVQTADGVADVVVAVPVSAAAVDFSDLAAGADIIRTAQEVPALLQDAWNHGGISPVAMFGANEPGFWYDFTNPAGLFSDAAGTVPITVGGYIAFIQDWSGNGNHCQILDAGKRPQFQTNGEAFWALMDGADDIMTTPAIDLSGTKQVSVFAAVESLSGATASILNFGDAYASAGAFELLKNLGGTGSNTFAALTKAPNTASFVSPATFGPGTRRALSWQFNTDGVAPADKARLRVGGVSQSLTVTDAVQGDVFSNRAVNIGSRPGALLPFNGRLFAVGLRGAATGIEGQDVIANYQRLKMGGGLF